MGTKITADGGHDVEINERIHKGRSTNRSERGIRRWNCAVLRQYKLTVNIIWSKL